MDAFTDIGRFLYISLDSYKVWMHLQTLVGFCTYLLILRKCGCINRHFTNVLQSCYYNHNIFHLYRQQDAQEFLRYLLSELHEETNTAAGKRSKMPDIPDDIS